MLQLVSSPAHTSSIKAYPVVSERASAVQAGSDGSLVPSRQSTEVHVPGPGRPQRPSLRCRQSTASEICHSIGTSLLFRSFDEARSTVGPWLFSLRLLGTFFIADNLRDLSLCSSSFQRSLTKKTQLSPGWADCTAYI